MAQNVLGTKKIHDDPDAIEVTGTVAAHRSHRGGDLLIGRLVRPRHLP